MTGDVGRRMVAAAMGEIRYVTRQALDACVTADAAPHRRRGDWTVPGLPRAAVTRGLASRRLCAGATARARFGEREHHSWRCNPMTRGAAFLRVTALARLTSLTGECAMLFLEILGRMRRWCAQHMLQHQRASIGFHCLDHCKFRRVDVTRDAELARVTGGAALRYAG